MFNPGQWRILGLEKIGPIAAQRVDQLLKARLMAARARHCDDGETGDAIVLNEQQRYG